MNSEPMANFLHSTTIHRRQFLKAASAGAVGLMLNQPGVSAAEKTNRSKWVFDHRVQFGAWINDMRNEALPRDQWPSQRLDSDTERDIIECLELGRKSGFNQVDIWGLFATSSYPVDIRSAFTDKERRKRADRILKAARERKIKTIFGLGVFSWGFDAIIASDPSVRGSNKHFMCPAAPASLEWQKKLIDAVVQELDVDGFHLESADQGRCSCEKCAKTPNVQFHSDVNIKTADYIRQKYPGKLVSCIIQGWSTWGKDFSDEEKQQLVNVSKHVDVIWDQGHRQTYVPREKRQAFISSLSCAYGTSGGYWVYPPPRWQRLQWFLPYVHKTGEHMKEIYAQGARGVMYYQGPIRNPGVEINIACGGRLLSDASQDIDGVLAKIIEELYRPKSLDAQNKLVEIYKDAEAAYFADWNAKEIEKVHKAPPPGEQHVAPLFGDSPGAPIYLMEPFLDENGRKNYRKALLSLSAKLDGIDSQFNDNGRIGRMKECLINAIQDIDTIASSKGQKV
jgi:hypothetical protein